MYTKKQWKSDAYFNFGYVEYLPKDFDKNLDMLSTCPKTLIKIRNIRWFSFCTERASAAMIWMWQCATDI